MEIILWISGVLNSIMIVIWVFAWRRVEDKLLKIKMAEKEHEGVKKTLKRTQKNYAELANDPDRKNCSLDQKWELFFLDAKFEKMEKELEKALKEPNKKLEAQKQITARFEILYKESQRNEIIANNKVLRLQTGKD